jgi:hypothetical protein
LNALLAKGNPLAAPKAPKPVNAPEPELQKAPTKMTIFQDNDEEEEDSYAPTVKKMMVGNGTSFIDNSASLLKPVAAKPKALP